MTTEAQFIANRQNAQESTGPRTAEGKAAVSQNALKHGLFAVQDVTIAENQAEFDLLRDEMLAELAPVGVMESMLAARIVSLSWRLKRAERMQNEAIDVKIERDIGGTLAKRLHSICLKAKGLPAEDSLNSKERLALGYTAIRDFADARVLDQLLVYERRIESSLFKTMAELRELRLMRKLEAANAAEEKSAADTRPPNVWRASPAQDHNTDSAKQSQFAAAHNGATACVTEDYENRPRPGVQENEPRQSQFQAPTPEGAAKIEVCREVLCGSE